MQQVILCNERNEELIDNFLRYNEQRGKSVSLIRNYRYDLLQLLKSVHKNIEDVVIEDIEFFISILRENKCSGSTINRRIAAIRSFYRFLKRGYQRALRREKYKNYKDQDLINQLRGFIDEYNDIVEIETVKAIKKEKLPFTMEELARMLSAIKIPGNYRYKEDAMRNYLIIKLSAIGTGARNTAISHVLVEDLTCGNCNKNCDNCIPTIKLMRKGRTNKVRVRIEKETCKELKNLLNRKRGLLFISRKGNTLSIVQMNRILRKAMSLADIEPKGRTFHSLRHSFITECIKNGTQWSHVMIQVDHKGKLGVTGKYQHLQAEDLEINFPKLPI